MNLPEFWLSQNYSLSSWPSLRNNCYGPYVDRASNLRPISDPSNALHKKSDALFMNLKMRFTLAELTKNANSVVCKSANLVLICQQAKYVSNVWYNEWWLFICWPNKTNVQSNNNKPFWLFLELLKKVWGRAASKFWERTATRPSCTFS